MGDLTRAVDGLRRVVWTFGLLAPALAVGACSDQSSPLLDMPASPAARMAAGGAAGSHHPNSVKYRDSSRPATTGRSGTATLTGYSVLGGGGTSLTIVSGGLSDPGSGRGVIAKAQVKGFGPDGALLFTINFQKIEAGSVTLQLPALPSGGRVTVQANVRGIDGRRTDVVTLTDVVRHAPAVAAELNAPDDVPVNVPSLISGSVRETGGDVGVRADVVLRVDGQAVDRASNIWIDAGDAVAFAFVYAFPTAGAHDLQVVVTPLPDPAYVTPEEATASASVMVTAPPVYSGEWTADASDYNLVHATTFAYQWADGATHKEYSESTSNTTRTQTIAVEGTTARALGFPLSVDLELASGGAVRHEEHWTNVPGVTQEDGRVCVSREILEQGAAVLICTEGTAPAAYTSYSYRRFGRTITYHSEGFSHYFDGQSQNDVDWNSSYTYSGGGGQLWSWGSTLELRLGLTDASGPVNVHPVVAVSAFTEDLGGTPYACATHPDSSRPWMTVTECSSSADSAYGVRGAAIGQG